VLLVVGYDWLLLLLRPPMVNREPKAVDPGPVDCLGGFALDGGRGLPSPMRRPLLFDEAVVCGATAEIAFGGGVCSMELNQSG
jgi:hypothetical protein